MFSKNIIAAVAKKNGISYEECYAEMKAALLAGFNSNDPEVKKAWSNLPMKGKEPTPEDIISSISKRMLKAMFVKH